jgi:hypothetical protein
MIKIIFVTIWPYRFLCVKQQWINYGFVDHFPFNNEYFTCQQIFHPTIPRAKEFVDSLQAMIWCKLIGIAPRSQMSPRGVPDMWPDPHVFRSGLRILHWRRGRETARILDRSGIFPTADHASQKESIVLREYTKSSWLFLEWNVTFWKNAILALKRVETINFDRFYFTNIGILETFGHKFTKPQ